MNNCAFMIIIYINFVFGSPLNISDDLYPTCPVTLFRRKREQLEYTRWRANLETTQEFIVKVLDDDFTTPRTKKIIAVNIQPLIKGGEKIIIGGAMVPKPTTTVTPFTEETKDYTRFVPPTTVATRVDGEIYLSPVAPPGLNKVLAKPRGKHPHRDESPPSGPQFLPRTPAAAWQYAPITPVGFTRRTTLAPITPALSDSHKNQNINSKPTRTSSFDDLIVPTRKSDYEIMRRFRPYKEEVGMIPTRTTFSPQYDPEQTSLNFLTTPAKEFVVHPTTEENLIDNDKIHEYKKAEDAEDSDATYNMMFYNYDDAESGSKKTVKHSDEIDENETKDRENVSEIDTDSTEETTHDVKSRRKFVPQFTHDYEAPEESDNFTTSSTAKTTNIQIITKTFKDKDKHRPVCSMLKLRQLNFNSPRTLPEIVTQLKQWAENSPVAKWVDITDGNYTAMENPIYMMIVDDPSSGQIVTAKQTVMIVAGIQGRDQHAVAAAMYVLYQLIERSESHADLLSKYRFWIIPVFNPDGYDYSMTFPHRREWTKNLRQSWDVCKGREACHNCEAYGIRCTIQPCYGVNLDRNFEYQWIPGEELRSEHPCGSLYAGARQLSEAETRALTNFLHEQRTPIFTFVAFKEGDVLGVMYPYSHTKKRRAFDHVYRQRASRAAAAAYSISARPYVAGQTSEFLPLYAGGIEDWVDSHLGIDNTYTIVMFRPADTSNSKLVTERVVHEAYAAMDTLVLQSGESPVPPEVTMTRVKSAINDLTVPSLTELIIIIIALFI